MTRLSCTTIRAWAETKTGNELEPLNKIQVFMNVKDTLKRDAKLRKYLAKFD